MIPGRCRRCKSRVWLRFSPCRWGDEYGNPHLCKETK